MSMMQAIRELGVTQKLWPTGKSQAEMGPVRVEQERLYTDIFYEKIDEYRVQLILGRAVYAKNEKELTHMIGQVRHELVDYLYGHLKPLILDVERAVHASERGKAIAAIQELWKEISL